MAAANYSDITGRVIGHWSGGGGGGSQPGADRTLSFPFDFSMAAALADGVPVWTPAVGDALLNAWVETDDTPWTADGLVNPKIDIGIVVAGSFVPVGLFTAFAGNPVGLSDNATHDTSSGAIAIAYSTAATLDLLQAIVANGSPMQTPFVRFLTTDPLTLVVSGDGTPGSAAFDGSAGASTLYIKVCTPGDTP